MVNSIHVAAQLLLAKVLPMSYPLLLSPNQRIPMQVGLMMPEVAVSVQRRVVAGGSVWRAVPRWDIPDGLNALARFVESAPQSKACQQVALGYLSELAKDAQYKDIALFKPLVFSLYNAIGDTMIDELLQIDLGYGDGSAQSLTHWMHMCAPLLPRATVKHWVMTRGSLMLTRHGFDLLRASVKALIRMNRDIRAVIQSASREGDATLSFGLAIAANAEKHIENLEARRFLTQLPEGTIDPAVPLLIAMNLDHPEDRLALLPYFEILWKQLGCDRGRLDSVGQCMVITNAAYALSYRFTPYCLRDWMLYAYLAASEDSPQALARAGAVDGAIWRILQGAIAARPNATTSERIVRAILMDKTGKAITSFFINDLSRTAAQNASQVLMDTLQSPYWRNAWLDYVHRGQQLSATLSAVYAQVERYLNNAIGSVLQDVENPEHEAMILKEAVNNAFYMDDVAAIVHEILGGEYSPIHWWNVIGEDTQQYHP